MDDQWDVIIVGAGSAGCVLAGRLSEDPALKVLLLEAGPSDTSPFIRLPKGFSRLLSDPRHSYFYPTERNADRPGANPEVVVRGRVLGGTSSVNGMLYNRGQPQDYDDWAALGLRDWSWANMLPCFRALEDNLLPEVEWRGRGGPIPVRTATKLPRLASAMVDAAVDLGLPRKDDANQLKQLGIGPVAENIDARGRRVSAAHAFLPPMVRRRANLRILVDTRVDRIMFEGRRAVGVTCTSGGNQQVYRASREVVLSAGAMESPRILQISGVGPAAHLANIGVETVVDSPGVGANYRDHFCHSGQWRLRYLRDCESLEYSGWRLARNVLRHYVFGTGPLSAGAVQLVIFPEVMPGGTDRADGQIVWAPYSVLARPGKGNKTMMDPQPGCNYMAFPLRGTSEGTLMARSADPTVSPLVNPNYLGTEYDRAVTVRLVRFVRRLMTHPAMQPYALEELDEAAQAQTDDEIIDLVKRNGISGHHSCGTCKMGVDGDPKAVLDERLNVRGVAGLRVMDLASVPLQVSGNPNAPVMAMAWRLVDMMRTELGR